MTSLVHLLALMSLLLPPRMGALANEPANLTATLLEIARERHSPGWSRELMRDAVLSALPIGSARDAVLAATGVPPLLCLSYELNLRRFLMCELPVEAGSPGGFRTVWRIGFEFTDAALSEVNVGSSVLAP